MISKFQYLIFNAVALAILKQTFEDSYEMQHTYLKGDFMTSFFS